MITDLSQLEPLIINQVCAAVGNGKTSIEFCFDKSIGFVGGRTKLKEFIDVGETLGKANRELPKSKNIKICWNTSVSGGCSAIIYWENAE